MRHGSLFSCKQLGHPALFDLRDMSMSLIVQAEKSVRNVINTFRIACSCSRHFLLSDGINISIYSYEGRLVSTPKPMSSKPDSVNINTISISSDTVAIRDASDTKCSFTMHEWKPSPDFLSALSDSLLRHQWQTDWRRETCVSRCK